MLALDSWRVGAFRHNLSSTTQKHTVSTDSNLTSFRVTKLSPFTTYSFRVTAVSAMGYSRYSKAGKRNIDEGLLIGPWSLENHDVLVHLYNCSGVYSFDGLMDLRTCRLVDAGIDTNEGCRLPNRFNRVS